MHFVSDHNWLLMFGNKSHFVHQELGRVFLPHSWESITWWCRFQQVILRTVVHTCSFNLWCIIWVLFCLLRVAVTYSGFFFFWISFSTVVSCIHYTGNRVIVLCIRCFHGFVFWVDKQENLALLLLRQLWAIFLWAYWANYANDHISWMDVNVKIDLVGLQLWPIPLF